MILLIRILPLVIGCLEAAVFWWQRRLPGAYPFLALGGVAAFVLAVLVIARKRIGRRELTGIMAPSFILLLSFVFGVLLVEGFWPALLLAGLAGGVTFMVLELLFLHARNPALYPVNGLSHLNVALVPIAIWYTVSTSIGLLVFLHSDGVWHVLLVVLLSLALFRTTNHRDATRHQKRVWTLIGGLAGLSVGLMGLLLPVGMASQGFLAALILSATLRARRYLYGPKPSRRTTWIEVIVGSCAFAAALASAKWL